MNLIFAIWLGKLIRIFLRLTKLGGGSAAPGYYSLKLYPNLVETLSKQISQSVIITGTNGKTTTARLITHFAKHQKLTVLTNSTGSNMERGIASSLINKASLFGKIKDIDLAVWEVDEAGLKILAPKIKPQIIVFLNAARDQLDRYGELDSLVREWEETLSKIDYSPLILVNADDANTYVLTHRLGQFESFGLDKKLIQWEENTKQTTKPTFLASNIKENGLTSVSFTLNSTLYTIHSVITLSLPGIYNIYNFLAAFGVAYHLNFDMDQIIETTKTYSTAFGRVENLRLGGVDATIMLIKNPNGVAQTLCTLIPASKSQDKLLLALNDNLADGTDVSWIWDANFELLTTHYNLQPIICSGSRAYDLALRLKYAGIQEDRLIIEPNLGKALNQAKQDLGGRLFILPTYTALLQLQKILAKQGVKKHYWSEL